MRLSENQETVRRRVQTAGKQVPRYQPYLAFWEKILLLQARFSSEDSPDRGGVSDALANMKLREGFPLFSFKEFRGDPDRQRALFQHLLREVGTANPKLQQQKPLLEAWLQTEGRDLQPWLDRLFQDEGRALVRAAEKSGLDPGVLTFFLLASWKPFLKARARALSQTGGIQWQDWERGYCPVCGGMPMLAYLQQDGKRFGVCSLCEFSWNLPRLFCPHCETTDQKKLRYFFSENEKGHRVTVCKDCGHYLKTIDLRHQESEPVALLDDLLTTHLDLWARKKKFKRLAFSDRIF